MTHQERIAEIDKQITALNKERRELKEKIRAERREKNKDLVACMNCAHCVGHSDGSYGCMAFPVYGMSKDTKDAAFIRKVNGRRDRSKCLAFSKRTSVLFLTYHTEIDIINKQKQSQQEKP